MVGDWCGSIQDPEISGERCRRLRNRLGDPSICEASIICDGVGKDGGPPPPVQFIMARFGEAIALGEGCPYPYIW